jgi:hypothetical protein
MRALIRTRLLANNFASGISFNLAAEILLQVLGRWCDAQPIVAQIFCWNFLPAGRLLVSERSESQKGE